MMPLGMWVSQKWGTFCFHWVSQWRGRILAPQDKFGYQTDLCASHSPRDVEYEQLRVPCITIKCGRRATRTLCVYLGSILRQHPLISPERCEIWDDCQMPFGGTRKQLINSVYLKNPSYLGRSSAMVDGRFQHLPASRDNNDPEPEQMTGISGHCVV